MGKKLFIGLAPVVALAVAVIPMVAQAGPSPPHWIAGARVIMNEERVVVTNRGKGQTVTFDVSQPGALINCRVGFSDVITNPLSGAAGIDEMTAFQLTKCHQEAGTGLCPTAPVQVIAHGLPWQSHLANEVPAGAEGNNVIEGVELDFRCGGAEGAGTFKGSLSVLVRQLPNKPHCGGLNPHPCALFEYRGEPSLTGKSGTVAVTGADRIAGSTHKEIQVCFCDQRP